ncbi:alpha/beta hydrolase [Salipiger pacificus]|nr:alpha/beta hydrolase [Alloyangia pacifica]
MMTTSPTESPEIPRTDAMPAWRRLAAVALCLSTGLGDAPARADTLTEGLAAPIEARESASLRYDTTVGDLLRHSELQGFARRLLPWAERDYREEMPLRDIAQLLPYHSAVRPDVVLAGLNRLLDLQRAGVPVFHEIYTGAERRETPSLSEAGLFFFPGRPGAPFALIAPGGGFSYVGSVHEGFPYAMELSRLGFNAFVVTYRTGQGGRTATADMARAVDYVMEHAETLGVAREGYSVWGSSAGARMVAFIGSHGPDAFGAQSPQHPAAVIMAYTSHADLGPQEPPTYAIVGAQDGIAPAANMRARVEALRTLGGAVTFRVVPGVGHGFGDGTGTAAQGWVAEAAAFWAAHLPAELGSNERTLK